MDNVTYSLTKKIAASALSGVKSMSVSGQTLTINTKDSGVLTMTFPAPKDGVSVTDIDVNANNQIVFTMSDGSEIISGKIPTVKGDAGFSPTITENADNTDKIYKLDIETVDGTFTTPNLKGADGTGGTGGSGEENKIDSISVNGVNVSPDENKNVDITVPDAYDDTDIRAELAKKADTDHTHTTVNGHTVESDVPVDAKFTDTVYDDTQVKTQIQAVANGLMDSVGYSADYKSIDIIAKNGVKKSIDVAPIISHASITELSDIDTTNKATGKALVYNATTSKHEYADVSGTDEKVKMDASTDAKYLGELLDNVTIANENGELKIKKLDGQEVTITEINYLKGLTMNVMDLVNMFSNGGVKIISTPVATYAELLTLDKSSFIEGISYLVYVLADENHDNAKTTYLVDKDSETPTYFGFADSQRDFVTNPIDLATEITGKLGISNMDSDAIKALFTVDDTYKTETATNNAFSTHGAKALYDELLLTISSKANDSDLTAHKDDTDIHVSTEDRTKWDSAKTHADSAHAPSNAQANVLETVKVNGTALEVSDKAVNVTVPTTVAQLTDSADYAKKTDLHSHENKTVLDGITSDKVTYWDNKSEFSGSYNDLNDKPTIDAELSNTSENAIQNKVVTKEINKLYSDISFNDHDTSTSGTSFTDAENGNMLVTDCTRNLLNPTLETTTLNGVTCTNNGDGTYTLNGTATDNFNLYLCEPEFTKLTKGEEYRAVLYSNILNGLVFDITNNIDEGHNSDKIYGYNFICNGDEYPYGCEIVIRSGTVFNNVLIKPMLTTDLSATYDDFVPYGGYEIQTCGKNLFGIDKTVNDITATIGRDVSQQLKVTKLSDNSFKASPKASNNSWLNCYLEILFDDIINNLNDYELIFTIDHNDTGYEIFNYIGLDENYKRYVVIFGLNKQEESIDVSKYIQVSNIMLRRKGSTDTFEPYQDGGTVHVGALTEFPLLGLKSFNGITNIISPGNVKCVYPTNESGKGVLDSLYNKDKMLTEQKENLVEQKMLGWTVPSECPVQNYVDSDGVFHQIVGRVDLGSLNWTDNGDHKIWYTPHISNSKVDSYNGYCKDFEIVEYAALGEQCIVIHHTNGHSYIKFRNEISDIKQALQGVYLYYELEEENLIKVDGNEAVTKVNESLSVIGKCKNLLNATLQTTTQDGVTCTNNGDGTYTLNGTPPTGSGFSIFDLLHGTQKNIYGGCLFTGTPLPANEYRLYVGYFNEEDEWRDEKFVGDKGIIIDGSYPRISINITCSKGASAANNLIFKPMITTNLSATYDDFVPYTGEGETLTHDVAEIKNDLGGLTFSASGTTLSITDGTHTWTLGANS